MSSKHHGVEREHNWTSSSVQRVSAVLVQWEGSGYAHSKKWSWTTLTSKTSARSSAETALVHSILRVRGAELIKLWHQRVLDCSETVRSQTSTAFVRTVGSFRNTDASCWASQLLSTIAYSTAGVAALDTLLGPSGRSLFGQAVQTALAQMPPLFWYTKTSQEDAKIANTVLKTFMQACSCTNLQSSSNNYKFGLFVGMDDAWAAYMTDKVIVPKRVSHLLPYCLRYCRVSYYCLMFNLMFCVLKCNRTQLKRGAHVL
jgi:hypothetical protein